MDYDFYTDVYQGDSIPAEEFLRLARRAGTQLERYKRDYQVTAPAPDSEALAICAMADALYIIRHAITGGRAPLSYVRDALSAVLPGKLLTAVILFSLLLLFLFDWADERQDAIRTVSSWPAWVRWPVYLTFLLLLLLFIPKESAAPFIYFQF